MREIWILDVFIKNTKTCVNWTTRLLVDCYIWIVKKKGVETIEKFNNLIC